MLSKLFANYRFLLLVIVLGLCNCHTPSAQAATIDPYISRYLHITEPIELLLDQEDKTGLFSPSQLAAGKKLFESNCINCHVGGATLPDPDVSLSLNTLKAAHPPRDRINSLVAFMRQPMTYDGSQETYWCRQLSPSLLSQQQVENLAAFVLTAAQKAPGWGTEKF
ncbi:photosystem II cytochrome PsbV2 [Fortiea contorta]|uniref:photosystem II cytochrome PsbV2 n=1 Tax=Fortiea contorta TaxID=1892405 RepID=UPI00034B9C0E|nr:photosystem II cytochrome PsbV2 [Fortiea contorta]